MKTDDAIPFFSERQLSGLDITTSEIINSIEVLIKKSENKTAWSAPVATILPEDGRYMMAALAAADSPSLLAVKTVVLNPQNPKHGLPQINGLVTMLDSCSGLPIAILDGNWVTAIRTAGLSATAAKYMARKDSSIVACIGCGVQAKSHLQTFSDIFPLKEVRLLGRGKSNIDSLCEEATQRSITPVVCHSAKEAIECADLVISSVTFSSHVDPFLDANWLKPGSFSAVIDLAAPWKKETFFSLDQVFIDDIKQEAALPNKLAPPEVITGDLSALVLGKCDGRSKESDRNVFIFRGHAMGDLALSILAYQKLTDKKH